jgi:putative tributyrin esterase
MAMAGLKAVVIVLALSASRAPAGPPTVTTIDYESPSVGRTLKAILLLPAGYDTAPERRYPVLYLLHGWSGNYNTWSRYMPPVTIPQYPWIVVMPDGGNSWWVNWACSEGGQKNHWEDSVIKDLMGHIDSTYRTIARREGRAIDGMSMGGYGALVIGLRHPDLFCSIASQAGALAFARTYGQDLRAGRPPFHPDRLTETPREEIKIAGFRSQAERWPRGKIWETPEQCDAHDPYQLVLRVPEDRLPHIYFDGGTEDGFLPASQDLLKVLMEHKIPFTYAQSHGDHGGSYWRSAVGPSMAAQFAAIQRSLARAAAEARDKGLKAAVAP